MLVELNHGSLNVTLQVCNDAWLTAVTKYEHETETSFESVFSGSSIGFGVLMMYYAYFSYKTYCTRNRAVQKYNINEFKDLWTNREVRIEESNVSEVIAQLSESILPDDAKKKLREMQEEKA